MRTVRVVSVVMFAFACSEGEPDLCRPGFLRAADGHCYPPPPDYPSPSIEDTLSNLPPCFPHKPIGDIDFEAGCADNACVDDTFEEWTEALGAPDACDSASFSNTQSSCTWGERGILSLFEDEDEDTQPDIGSTADRVHLLPGHPGATLDGLGTDIEPRCYIDALGTPREVDFIKVSGTLLVEALRYDRPTVQAFDWVTVDGPDHADGIIDNVLLFGP